MAPTTRAPALPSIPDIALDLEEKLHLLPDLDEVTVQSSTTLDEDDDFRPSRSHSTHTQHSLQQQHRLVHLPSRFPSISSVASGHATYTSLPLSPRRHDASSCYPQPLSLPSTQKTLHESWTITYHHPSPPRTTALLRILGVTLLHRVSDNTANPADDGSVLSVVPNTHFSQAELAATVRAHEAACLAAAVAAGSKRGVVGRGCLRKPPLVGTGTGEGEGAAGVYAAEVERRVRELDWKVQDELYELVSDRVQSSSSAFRRREWSVVVLVAVPGGELTDAPTGLKSVEVKGRGKGGKGWVRRWLAGVRARRNAAAARAKMPITEYRLILRGTETKVNDQGWGYYNRYSRPWGMADDKEMGERRRWSSLTSRSDKYVDF
ncbi:hypothetical protein C8A05DRAFT_31781 [Staphylotrichum tortipilum]|uniref:Uncharacterized protein n=1 Tax=Staphylotrichum tortipilum TaxID=2831512 RepID=A0AAN6MQA9_9PEZI|nr:hypothetical protein C8A05DRAFT_31781 [Staphylotrichum longicolle]